MDLSLQQRKLASWVRIGLFALVALVVSPIIFMIVKGIVGLAIAAGLIALTTWGVPILGDVFSNWKLGILKSVASSAPIETMQNIFRDRAKKIQEAMDLLTEFGGEVRTFASQVESLVRRYPDQKEKYEGILKKMQEVLEFRTKSIQNAKAALKVYGDEINKAQAVWEVSQSALRLNKKMKLTDGDILNEIKSKTAIDSVEKSLNMAMSELDTALLMEVPALDFGNTGSSVQSLNLKEQVRA